MVHFNKAIKRPFSDSKKLLIGFLLYLIPFVNIITGIFAYGYLLECAKASMKKEYKLPPWKNWGRLFVKGLLAIIISIVYSIPLIIIGGIAIVGIFGGVSSEIFTTPTDVSTFSNISLTAGYATLFVVALIIAVLTFYVVPLALMNYVAKGKFKAGFDFRAVFRKAFTLHYLTVFLLALIYIIITSVILALLTRFTTSTVILPLIFQAFFNIIVGISIMTLFGEGYSELRR